MTHEELIAEFAKEITLCFGDETALPYLKKLLALGATVPGDVGVSEDNDVSFMWSWGFLTISENFGCLWIASTREVVQAQVNREDEMRTMAARIAGCCR